MYTEILVFTCNWDGWSCIETASNLGLRYPAAVKIVKVSCLSRIHAGLILKAFELGADGVMLLGCERGRCHFGTDNEYVIKEYEKTQRILEMLGIRKSRLTLIQLPAFDGHEFIVQVTKLIAEIEQISTSKNVSTIGSKLVQGVKASSYANLILKET